MAMASVSSCIVVTGANKGIGRALVEQLLETRPDVLIFLGSRDAARGAEACRDILASAPADKAARLEPLQIDVSDAASIDRAAAHVAARGIPLRAVVNNAGVAATARVTYETNVLGAARVTDAFLPALRAFASSRAGGDGDARVVNVSSGVAPTFVSKCAAARKAWFASTTVPSRGEVAAAAAAYFETLDRFEAAGAAGDAAAAEAASAALQAEGYPAPDARAAYSASKAFLTADTRALAVQLEAEGVAPHAAGGAAAGGLRAVACSPGFIETDMTRAFFTEKTPSEAGALPPAAATRVLTHLLFSEARNGWFYGSDAKRSPLDVYRSPGAPEHEGDV